jgi:hypothetical protein
MRLPIWLDVIRRTHQEQARFFRRYLAGCAFVRSCIGCYRPTAPDRLRCARCERRVS